MNLSPGELNNDISSTEHEFLSGKNFKIRTRKWQNMNFKKNLYKCYKINIFYDFF